MNTPTTSLETSRRLKEEDNPFELRHLNRRKKCLACEQMYLYQIKTLEKQIEVLTEMLTMKHLSEPIRFEVSNQLLTQRI